VVTISGTVQIDGTAVPRISIGDRFTYQLQIQDAVVDSEASDKEGEFLGALLSITLSRAATNTGSWDPAGGTFQLGSAVVGTEDFSKFITVDLTGVGFQESGNGFPFRGFTLFFQGGLTVNDSGAGQTLAEQLNGSLTVAQLTESRGGLGFGQVPGAGIGAGGPASAIAIPEPGGPVLFICGSWIFCRLRSRQR